MSAPSDSNSAPRVRIAPSPTGDPHVGTAYMGLFNYAFARRHGGKFILRIEDTDQARSTPGSEQAIFEALRWLGIEWDEGPDVGGPFGPYRQSERLPTYALEVERLLQSGHAYRCFCTRERLAELRKQQVEAKGKFGYDGHCRSLDPETAKARAEAGEACVVRLRVPDEGETLFVDGLRGTIRFANAEIDDQVLMKSDGFPTYHLANVVDDHRMGITHVIRGEEWITSTPKHVLLYQAFGWKMPEFFHLGLLRNPDGTKLSKRKNPVSVFYYREMGYLPETFVNFMGTLGFSMGDDVERFTLAEMVEAFEWEKVHPGGPVFDPVKLAAFNADDIRDLDDEELYRRLLERVLPRERLMPMVRQTKERIKRLDDFVPYVACFFGGEVDYRADWPKAQKKVKKRARKEVVDALKGWLDEIERDPRARAFDAEGLEAFSRDYCEASGFKAGELFTLLRLASTGRMATPPLFDTLEIVGKDRMRERLRGFIAFVAGQPDWAAADKK